MVRNVDAAGNPIAEGNGLYFESSPALLPCAVPGCTRESMTFGVLTWGGPIGYVCFAQSLMPKIEAPTEQEASE
jgi:hypothetical protein